MSRYRHAVLQIALSIGLGLLLTGCILRSMIGRVEFTASIEDVEYLNTTIDSHATMVLCMTFDFGGHSCSFYVDGDRITSTVRLLSELGVVGWFIDPLVAQVPDTVHAVTATYDLGSGPQPLVVSWVQRFKVTHSLSVTAEAGHRFLILELPHDVETLVPTGVPTDGLPISYTLRYAYTQLPSQAAQPQTVKLMMTGRVELNGHKYYVPLLPCVTDFALVPALTLPQSTTSQNLVPALGTLPVAGCDNQVYFFHPEAPAHRLYLPLARR